jgi:hypothetical protein
MSNDINLADPGIWDDSALIDFWNEALEEYKVTKSIPGAFKATVG